MYKDDRMPVPIDPITHKKLILVKQLYQQAIVQSNSKHSIVSRILSVIEFDLAIETLLYAIVRSIDSNENPKEVYDKLIEQAEKLLLNKKLPEIPDKANIKRIHSIRNDAQHRAKYPNETDLNDCRTYARDFLEKVITNIWNIPFEKISLTNEVLHEQVKKFLVEAETALSQGDYQVAVKQAATGLTLALNRVERAIVGNKNSYFGRGAFLVKGIWGELEANTDIFSAFMRMQETLLYVSLGMKFNDYMHFRQIAGYIVFSGEGREPSQYDMKESINVNDAEFVVMYSIESVVQIEGIVGNLDAPFGKEYLRWY